MASDACSQSKSPEGHRDGICGSCSGSSPALSAQGRSGGSPAPKCLAHIHNQALAELPRIQGVPWDSSLATPFSETGLCCLPHPCNPLVCPSPGLLLHGEMRHVCEHHLAGLAWRLMGALPRRVKDNSGSK